MKKTPLNAVHKQLGARMVPFAGWEMPVQYRSALQEHLSVRSASGLFDVSHMGEIELKGPDALNFAQMVACNDLNRLSDGQAQYSAFLYPQGTFVDDILVYRISAEHIFICVNAANREKDFQWLLENRRGDVEVIDSSDQYAQIALQGPGSEVVLQPLTDTRLSALRYYAFDFGRVDETPALISRTGYTGEPGFEIYVPPDAAERIWQALLESGRPHDLVPAGLAARNTLRLEVCYPLYGNDIGDRTTPLEAGLGWIVRFEKEEFIGRQALEKQNNQGIRRKLVGFELLQPGIARDHFPVYVEGKQVSEVTSGSYSPSLEKSIGLVYLPIENTEVEDRFEVDIRGKAVKAAVVKTPFFRSSH